MNADNVRLWLEDLESGCSPQARGALCELDAEGEPVGYCCLGRACEVAIAHGLELKVSLRVGATMYNNCILLLPEAVREWLGIVDRDVDLASVDDFYSGLAVMNDEGATFPEIAAYIREHVTGL